MPAGTVKIAFQYQPAPGYFNTEPPGRFALPSLACRSTLPGFPASGPAEPASRKWVRSTERRANRSPGIAGAPGGIQMDRSAFGELKFLSHWEPLRPPPPRVDAVEASSDINIDESCVREPLAHG